MDGLNVADLKSALEGEGVTMDIISNKMNPLKTTKQRNTTNNHRKSQQRSNNVAGFNNSTDEEERVSPKGDVNHPSAVSGVFLADDEGFRKCEGDNENENTTNNDEQSGFVDSENDNITDRLCCLAKLSLHIGADASSIEPNLGEFSGACSAVGGCSADMIPSIPSTSKARNLSYPSFAESDSVNEISYKSKSQHHFHPIPSASGCPTGATTGDAASETMEDTSCSRRFRRRRRRRGHNTNNTKRMAVDASTADNDEGLNRLTKGYSIRPAECSSGGPHCSKHFNKFDKAKEGDTKVLDSFGMKRKRILATSHSIDEDCNTNNFGIDGDMDIADFGALSLNAPVAMSNDEEMKSYDDDYSSFESEDEKDADDQGREADDEQSDWVFDEWSTNSKKSQEESASSRKKRLMKMLRSYNTMISANAAGAGPLNSSDGQSREIRAGRRRVFVSKQGFPAHGVWTSANEEVSKFLQNPLQSQIRLQPVTVAEGIQISHLASLYSLQMDYCEDSKKTMVDQQNDTGRPGLKLFPVLTKTSNTTQMDKSIEPSVSSSFNAEGSSSSNVSSVYGPTYSDLDSKASDSKRIKK